MEEGQAEGSVPQWKVDWVELPALMTKRFRDNRYAPYSQSFVKRVLAKYGLDKEETAENGFKLFYKAATSAPTNTTNKERKKAESKSDECEIKSEMDLIDEDRDGDAAYILGWMYEEGMFLERDGVKAARWYQASADKGNPIALNNLGRLYDMGFGVEKDPQKALEYCRLAAEKGFSTAQYNLGLMYEDGDGVEPDNEKALELFRLAAEQGDPNGLFSLGLRYKEGGGSLGEKGDPIKALQYFQMAADQGYVDAYSEIGWMYMEGEGVEPDGQKAVEYYLKQAEEIQSEEFRAAAYYNLASIFEDGKAGIEIDNRLAANYYQAAVALNDADSQYQLGVMYEEGRGVDVDVNKSLELIQAAANQKCARATYYLALLYEDGDGVARDELKSLNLYWLASEQGSQDAGLQLGLRYRDGYCKYLPVDLARAHSFCKDL